MKKLLKSSAIILVVLLLNGNKNDPQDTDLPKIDLHAHLNWTPQSQTYTAAIAYEKASLLSKKMGVTLGIAEEFASNNLRFNDSLLLACITLAKKNSLYIGLQVSRRDWYNRFSKEIINQLDYILADALIFPNKDGRIISIWIPGMPLGEPQEFMDLYVAHNLKVLSEPITIWANPTYLPDELASRYDELWTNARMKSLIDAAVKNNVAIEINSRFKVPNAKFIKMAKAMGAHFTFGSNQHDVGFGEITWSINMAKESGLTKEDFFIPKRIMTKIVAKDIVKTAQQQLVDHTQKGVSPKLMSEYKNIVKKYHQELIIDSTNMVDKAKPKKWDKEFTQKLSSSDKERLKTIYFQMSKDQQEKQIVRFSYPRPLSRNVPTKEQLESFKDRSTYGIWINNKKVSNEVLNNYTNTDFALVGVSKVLVDSTIFGKPVLRVNLMTNDYFQSCNDQALSGKLFSIVVGFNSVGGYSRSNIDEIENK